MNNECEKLTDICICI